MQYKMFLFLLQAAIFVNNYQFISTEPIFGTEHIKPVDEHEFSSVACLMRNIPENELNRNIYCTATFISPTHLLSSATCVDESAEFGFLVNAGSHDIRIGHMYTPLWWLTYDRFAEIYRLPYNHPHNDISIIRLAEAVSNITPAPISKVPYENLSGLKVKIVGCGLSCTGESSMVKEEANVKILSQADCSNDGSGHDNLIYLICTSNEPGVFLAVGDFGGPLLYNGEIVAINIGVTPNVHGVTEVSRRNYHLLLEDYEYFIHFNLSI